MKLTLRQLKDIFFDDSDYQDTKQFVKIEETEWVDNGKEQYGGMIIQDTVTKQYYKYPICRSIGYDNASWYYERFDDYADEYLKLREIELVEVQPIETTKRKWTRVNN